jgi:hypothetical protein
MKYASEFTADPLERTEEIQVLASVYKECDIFVFPLHLIAYTVIWYKLSMMMSITLVARTLFDGPYTLIVSLKTARCMVVRTSSFLRAVPLRLVRTFR